MFSPKKAVKIANVLRKANKRMVYLTRKSREMFSSYKQTVNDTGESFDWNNKSYEPHYKQTHVFIMSRDVILIDENYVIEETGYDPNEAML